MNEESQDNDKARAKPGPKGEHKWGSITKEGIKVGREGIVVPPDEIEHLASLGVSDREIAAYFNVHENTLRYNFKEFLVKGRHRLKVTLRQAQLRVALDGNPTMLIWLGKNILSQNDAGTTNDENRALPWTDEMDDEVNESDEDDTINIEADDAST